MSNTDALRRYAISCNYKHHDNFAIQNGQLVAVEDPKLKASKEAIIKAAVDIFKSCNENDKPMAGLSLKIIRDRFQRQHDSWFSWLFYNKTALKEHIKLIDETIGVVAKPVHSDKLFLLRFLSSLPSKLSVSHAPGTYNHTKFQWRNGKVDKTVVNEWNVLEFLGKQVFESEAVQSLPKKNRQSKFNEIMLGAYKGDHFLIQDDAEYSRSKELHSHGAIVRGSSHYENGRKILGWDEKGKPVYASESHEHYSAAEVNHYGLTGKHIKHILFNAVEVQLGYDGDDRVVVAHKTARQVQKLMEKNTISKKFDPADTGRYFAFQTESSEDCEGNNWRCASFYSHRLKGFLTYRALLLLGVKSANVGAYGFGKTGDDPVILSKHKLKAITVS